MAKDKKAGGKKVNKKVAKDSPPLAKLKEVVAKGGAEHGAVVEQPVIAGDEKRPDPTVRIVKRSPLDRLRLSSKTVPSSQQVKPQDEQDVENLKGVSSSDLVIPVERGVENPTEVVNVVNPECEGYAPNLATGVCRCKSCRSKPHAGRTKRPFWNAQTAGPTTPIAPKESVPISGTSVGSLQTTKGKGLMARTKGLSSSSQGSAVTGKKTEGEDSRPPQQEEVLGSLSVGTDISDARSAGSASTLPGSKETHPMVSAATEVICGETKMVSLTPEAGKRFLGEERGVLSDTPLVMDTAPHLIIKAGPGCGKTTTDVEGVKLLLGFGTHLVPSAEQKAIWDCILLSKGVARTVCVTAFSNPIVYELKGRVPPGCDAKGIHSMGYAAVRSAFQLWPGKRAVNNDTDYNHYRTEQILGELLKVGDMREYKKEHGVKVSVVNELVSLCKVNLVGYRREGVEVKGGGTRPMFVPDSIREEELDELVSYYDIEMDGTSRDEVYPLIPQVLQRSLDVGRDRFIDFNDMIWLPVVLNLPVQKYDLLLVDESQDLNRCQQVLVRRIGDRLILCGDENQAIFGFAGADTEAMERLERELKATDRGVVTLPLATTRRCGKAIVAEATKIYPGKLVAHESNPEGKISYMKMGKDAKVTEDYRNVARDGDMVLCRVNAPLVSECFRFIKMGKKANIQGRDVGRGLVKSVEKMRAKDVGELVTKLEQWTNSEVEKERSKAFPSEGKIINLQDKLDCIMCFVEGVDVKDSPSAVTRKIEAVFTDDKNATGIRLSSMHRSKGLESPNVFILQPEGASCPHPMAKSERAIKQEWNLLWVARTRAIKSLTYVT